MGFLKKKKGHPAFFVTPDLFFIDYISKPLMVFDGIPAVKGLVLEPMSMEEGMTHFLKDLNLTFRRDEESGRPRANKEGSVKDREQKAERKYYYS